ncbi:MULTISPECIES: xanthine dehydrogenase family protein subunit M [unclassified Pseudactinotalea]|uniref:FAD binding domain-containing protein n=1 Tax=unclassified Pseudactinotalea TaxID=2649176 RepID=UPI00128D6D4A|nr:MULTISPECIES: xanthine dehydrogenase family protein subunit M [unclassified Pseudactinotalea]MPV49643.1 xanthine dehydrogenase family protein subunit M [Pseudactinotalea sp. HY160]QGH69943.1 xanthine dehydrogenase family protein subunit M [Pseudactinotalea sp. HY158]
MIPSTFDYEAPATVAEAVTLLARDPMNTKILAGGQSLIPVLKLRMADPELVIGLQHIDGLRGIRVEDDRLVIGPMTRHHDIATDPLVAAHAGLLARAAGTVADPQVRHRGTIGGAIVHADPAGDMSACLLALEAELTITGPAGPRTVSAADFFVDYFTTAVGEDELLTEIRVPLFDGWGSAYEKFTRVAQQWSIVAVAACVRLEGEAIAGARVALTNMGSVPVRAAEVEQALVGGPATPAAVTAACAAAGAGTEPPSDLNGDEAYRLHLATVLARRAVLAAATPR